MVEAFTKNIIGCNPKFAIRNTFKIVLAENPYLFPIIILNVMNICFPHISMRGLNALI